MIGVRTVTLPSGRVLGYAEYGAPDGQPVLAFHGTPASRNMFAIAHAPARASGLRLIAPDRPGYGLTPYVALAAPLAAVAEDMTALADRLGLDRLGLIGISGGAPYAVATAARLGPRAAAMALVSPVGPLTLTDPALIARGQRWFFLSLPRHRRALRLGAGAAAALFNAAPRLFARLFAATLPAADRRILLEPASRTALIDFTREALRQGVDGALADHAAYARPWPIDPAAIATPTLLWQGTNDHVVPQAAASRLAALIPRCRTFRLEGAGHFWVMQHASEVLDELARAMDGAGR